MTADVVEQHVLSSEPQSAAPSGQQSLFGPPEQTPVWGNTSSTAAAPVASPTSALATERTCS